MYARSRRSIPLDERRLLLNGLQNNRLSGGHCSKDGERPQKRQRIEGMNSRYDRMIETVNVMHTSPYTPSDSGHSHRRRQLSASSATTYDAPETPGPVEHNGSLGQGFSVLKMKGSDGPSVMGQDPFDPSAFRSSKNRPGVGSPEPYPPWLRGAISTLDARNPLRSLLSDRPSVEEESNSSANAAADESSGLGDSPFAFAAPDEASTSVTISTGEPIYMRNGPRQSYPAHCSTGVSELHSNREHSPARISHFRPGSGVKATAILPFSMPGTTFQYTSNPYPGLRPQSPYPCPTSLSPGFDYHPPFVPFSEPGPLCAPLTDPVSYHNELTIEPNTTLRRESARSPQPSARTVRPFSTPGPMAQPRVSLLGGTSVQEQGPYHSPVVIMPFLSRSPSPSVFKPDMYGIPSHILPLSCPNPNERSQLPSPRSSSVERFLSNYQEEYLPFVTRSSSNSPIEERVSVLDVDYDTLDFKWQKFDRGDIILDAPSSSPRAAEYSSEEAFWGQSTAHIPTPVGLSKLYDPENIIDSSPGSLRLTGIASTPVVSPARASQTPHMHKFQNRSGIHQSPNGDDLNPLVPRTPRSTRRTALSPVRIRGLSRDLESASSPERLGEDSAHPDQVVVAAKRGSNGRNPEVEATGSQARPPFAPAPGIYISPLRENSESELQTWQCAVQGKDINVKEKKKLQQTTQRSSDRAATRPAMSADPARPVATNDAQASTEDAISQATTDIASATPEGDGSIEEIEEDEPQDCSQESRETIESWSD